MKPINVGLLGAGTVGGGTFEVLARNQEEITRRAGRGIVITLVADKDLERARRVVGKAATVTADALEVVNHPDIDIVIELIGGTTVAHQLILKAIEDKCAIGLRARNLTNIPWLSCQPPNVEAAVTDHWPKPAGCEE